MRAHHYRLLRPCHWLPSIIQRSMATCLYDDPCPSSSYIDHQLHITREEYSEQLRTTTTVYVGNLSYYTSEDQLYALFERCGNVQRVVMGLDRRTKTPCGFCFVEFSTHEEAGVACDTVTGTKLDDRVIRVDWDAGFKEGRQYGRGRSGAQKRDVMREDYDRERGGYGGEVLDDAKLWT